tara:strand:- start:198 stop:1298 length:1101 start_codon:yes stop_codon:yes gene_type:complete
LLKNILKMKNNFQIFKGKKIIVTGHTGFKGSWLCIWLNLLGAKVYGISLKPNTRLSHYRCTNLKKYLKKSYIFNIQDKKKLQKVITTVKPDFLFHLAGQSIVKLSYIDPVNTWSTNLIGTINVLESLRKIKKCTAILITSDKCYKNIESTKGYSEEDKLGGDDPYSASKASAELSINSYYKTFFSNTGILLCSVRAGNVIGGGDWSPNRIIPDFFKYYFSNKKLIIRNPNSIRPWQHVLDALNGYLLLAKKLHLNKKLSGEAFNFGPKKIKNFKVRDLIDYLNKDNFFRKDLIIFKKSKDLKETNILKLRVKKSQKKLKWKSNLDIKKSLDLTKDWFVSFDKKNFDKNYELSKSQIIYFNKFTRDA